MARNISDPKSQKISDLFAYEALEPGDWIEWMTIASGHTEADSLKRGHVISRYSSYILVMTQGGYTETIHRNMVRCGETYFKGFCPKGERRSEKEPGAKKR